MKVSEFQKYLRALADAVGADKAPGKDLAHAANALAPFATSTVEQLAAFLALAADKYKATGELPDGKPPKAVKEPMPPKAGKPTADQFAARIAELKAALDRGEPLTRQQVEADIAKYGALAQADLDTVMDGLQFPKRVKPKAKALDAIVTHILAAKSAADRVKI